MRPTVAYIDFEALKHPSSSAALLGILIDRGDSESFEQVVLDERLRAAAVARPHVRYSTLDNVVSRIIGLDLPIVGWSQFDRDVVARSDVDPELTALWVARYFNALPEARKWRANVHPQFPVARASRFDPRHTLDRYAELAGYPDAAQFRGATPAKWIRHVLDQLAARTHYRRVTRQAKRDWHSLLEYNRHDCAALRHVHLIARSELQKWRAYASTDYYVHAGGRRPIRFRIDSVSARVDALLARYGSRRWMLMTAWNPESKPLPREENERRQTALIAELTAAGYRCLRAEGRNADASWPPEESVFVLDIPKHVARRIGHQYGQLAIVSGELGSPSRLVACL
jgi:hypothetical protein